MPTEKTFTKNIINQNRSGKKILRIAKNLKELSSFNNITFTANAKIRLWLLEILLHSDWLKWFFGAKDESESTRDDR